jgi:hypothetical protein
MKNKTIILSLTMALMIGIGTTAYAASSNSQTGTNFRNRPAYGMGLGMMDNFRGHDILTNLLKEKGATDEEINSALNSGKTLYDFASEKGLTDEEIKNYMVNEKTKAIDDAVASGKITAEEGTEAKNRIQENSANCTFENQGNGQMRGNMNHQGRMGMGRNR